MAPLTMRRVLVLEDDYYQADDFAALLRQAGAEVLGPFVDEAAALASKLVDGADCAILDINFGLGASYVLADRLVDRGTPFLFVTGYDREAMPARFERITRLQKPVGRSRLIGAIEELHRNKSTAT